MQNTIILITLLLLSVGLIIGVGVLIGRLVRKK